MLTRKFLTLIALLFITVTAIAAPLPTYEITIKDGVFSPSSIEVPAKQRFKIIIKNIGSGPAEFENLSMRVEKVLAAGVSSFVVIHPLKPGSYHFIDEFHLDMAGFTINVK
ncbi:cupredoxin domain-containing protein [Entomomonas asaccharolytica]|uniref:Cupredoxin domain-containing protein n=1 Tax=Entomomonas asaccharolytica TaxID=2785331 RepID=A0A974RYT4_9GAMM|nr:cupredoxin domain-containing protein [Entomomonas asaccharolytica]QQP86254.1 cupredoxin domain-containing protein [Entomomonas asaccharolytica]